MVCFHHIAPPNLYYIRNIFKILIKSGEIHPTAIELSKYECDSIIGVYIYNRMKLYHKRVEKNT